MVLPGARDLRRLFRHQKQWTPNAKLLTIPTSVILRIFAFWSSQFPTLAAIPCALPLAPPGSVSRTEKSRLHRGLSAKRSSQIRSLRRIRDQIKQKLWEFEFGFHVDLNLLESLLETL